jgi:hypothetical protein
MVVCMGGAPDSVVVWAATAVRLGWTGAAGRQARDRDDDKDKK